MLYIVPTPIGNLQDITLRALDVLKEVTVILAEDTRTSRKLLQHFGIETNLKAHHAHNEHKTVPFLVDALKGGQSMALISDAGMPGISDPGYLLIRACVEANVEIQVLPGATSFVLALVASGLPCDRFHFEGFLPHKKGRQTRLLYLAGLPHTFALFESPHRLVKCLMQLSEHCGLDRKACVCRELTKMHEEIKRGTIAELIEYYGEGGPGVVKGEIVLVVEGSR